MNINFNDCLLFKSALRLWMSDRHTLRMLSLKCHTKKVDLSEVVFIFKYLRNCRNITSDELEFWNISFEEFLRNLICRSFAFALHFELDGLFFNWPGTLRHECFFAQGKSEALNDANLREVSKGSMTARPPAKPRLAEDLSAAGRNARLTALIIIIIIIIIRAFSQAILYLKLHLFRG